MAGPSNRDKLLRAGMRVVQRTGFVASSVRDIVHAAGVPQGSFTNHFTSKEAFGLELLEISFAKTQELIADTLENEALAPLDRIRSYLAANRRFFEHEGKQCGCLYGNTSAEAGEGTSDLRRRNTEILDAIERSLARAITAAIKTGDLAKKTRPAELATFVLAGLQGATLLAKARRSAAPIVDLEHVLFTKVLVR